VALDNDVPRTRRVTLKDVAERAGVSFKTVSRVVNGEASVSPELAARVRGAVEELGYHPHALASFLRRLDGRTRALGVVLEDLANPFSSELHRAVVDTAHENGLVVLAASSDEDPVDERAALELFAARQVDGMILMPTNADHGWMGEQLPGTHVVAVDRPAVGLDADAVLSDNRAAAARATTHLARRGHERIAFLGDLRRIWTAQERFAGFEEACAAAGIEPAEGHIRRDLHDIRAAEHAIIEMLSEPDPPTAIFASQNLLTVGAVRALRRLALHWEIALIGFDDVVLAELLEPAISVVAQDPHAIGKRAAELLLERIDGSGPDEREHVLPTRLIPRGSGEIAPPG
jgi:LacI family transcriptional regulator, galactose operon repressor